MSQPAAHALPPYEPVSVHADDFQDIPYYNYSLPPSPNSHSPSLQMQQSDVPPHIVDPPFIPPRPRFFGPTAVDDGIRQSYASSQGASYTTAYDDGGSSVYALNAGARDSSASGGYSVVPYDDQVNPGSAATFGPIAPSPTHKFLEEKHAQYATPRKSKRLAVIAAIIFALILAVTAVIVAIYFTVIKKHSSSTSSATSNSSATPSPSGSPKPNSNAVVSGGDGSTVTMDDGTTFTYNNKFGGNWYYDPQNPFNDAAQANSWTPPLNQSFRYGVDRIFGVNIGGWLVPEPFIAPALFEKYISNPTPPVDEWTLSQAMAADTQGGGLQQLENHYKTFITEKDFAEMAGAGLNYVRIPLGYWAIEVRAGEPFLPKTSWTYFLKAIQWARKYGIRINLDFHAVPGSQNGWNHSGRLGSINFLYGPMGMANAQRTLDYVRIIAEFISQPEYKNVVTMFGIINEPRAAPTIGQENLANFYGQAYNVVRLASGVGQGNGPFISLHDGFEGLANWAGFMTHADRVSLDIHPYLCFGTQSSNTIASYATTPCSAWGAQMNTSMSAFGLTAAGEWSNAVTDCGKWLNGVNLGARYDGTYQLGGPWPSQGSCTPWTDYGSWTASQKAATMQFALASMDSLQNWFFWTWKIGNSSISGKVESPSWSYQLGLENGWMPLDPRQSSGVCGNQSPFVGGLAAWQTGGAGAGVQVASNTLVWPPTSLSNAGAVSLLPSYTPTGSLVTLPAPTFTQSGGSSINAGSGWANNADQAGMNVPIPSCSYLDPWVGNAPPPSPLCSGAAKRFNIPSPAMMTPAPGP